MNFKNKKGSWARYFIYNTKQNKYIDGEIDVATGLFIGATEIETIIR